MHFEMTFTCVLMKSKVSKLVFYLLCVLGIGQLEQRRKGWGWGLWGNWFIQYSEDFQ